MNHKADVVPGENQFHPPGLDNSARVPRRNLHNHTSVGLSKKNVSFLVLYAQGIFVLFCFLCFCFFYSDTRLQS